MAVTLWQDIKACNPLVVGGALWRLGFRLAPLGIEVAVHAAASWGRLFADASPLELGLRRRYPGMALLVDVRPSQPLATDAMRGLTLCRECSPHRLVLTSGGFRPFHERTDATDVLCARNYVLCNTPTGSGKYSWCAHSAGLVTTDACRRSVTTRSSSMGVKTW